ncbi:tetratricopeptide repeat protein [Anabaena minutissima FACHB-250]|nr:tetratricopeptide repeat protein [Anabaena minutissima FACHB-250]
MADLITQICQIAVGVLTDHPQASTKHLTEQLKLTLNRDAVLQAALKSDDRLIQINQGSAIGFQTIVEDGIANIGIHLTGVDRDHLTAIVQEVLQSYQPVGIPQNLPRSGVVDFCGRQEMQNQIHEHLSDEKSLFKTLAIVGMGGVGKTEVVLQYALNSLELYPGGICWIYAKNQDIASQIIGFARIYLQISPSKDLSVEDQLRLCWNYWSRKSSLIIFDDVSSYESVKLFLPPNEPRFRVLLTSRSQLGSSIKHLLLDTLDEGAAIAVLKSLANEERIQRELPIAKQICNWLGYLPLGLELVGRYLGRRSELSLAVLQQRLEDKKLLARAISQAEQDMTRPLSISAAFELSWAELSAKAKSLAYALCLFAPSPIPWELVQRCLSSWDAEDLEDLREETLLNSHLLHRNGNDEFNLHQLVREFFREKTDEIEQASEFHRSIANGLSLIAKEIPESLTQTSLLQLGAMIPHITEVAASLCSYVDADYFTYSFQGLGRYFEGQGFYSRAEENYKQCFALSKKGFGDQHINTVDSMSSLASIYYIQGRYEEAETLQRQALSIKTSLLGEEHLEIADLMNDLALTLEEEDNYATAEDLHIRAMSIRNHFLGREHADFTDSLNNLAVLYNAQGRYTEAEQLLLEALETRRFLLGEQHPRVATSLNNFASCYYEQQRFEDAEKLYTEALDLYKLVHQRKHRDVAIALNNLAQVYSEQEKYSAAVPLLQEALDIQEAILGSEHPDVATALNNLASLYEDLGRKHEAEKLYKDALAMRRKLLGNESIDVAISLNNLAKFLHVSEQYVEAKPLYVESLEILQQKLEVGHPLLEKISANLNELSSFLEQ